ncbi:DUF1015 domain-containing protein [Streptomyces sp. NBC_01198]|uniref:DUF1015 domain-containing protein n=1 Tax=Streptomyces sp. NBC_01198 TaxID=2903769 RepID=UPI002E1251E1|nr:DUF1015 domain-containing protein [Streptomyces sp. NBC_01198]
MSIPGPHPGPDSGPHPGPDHEQGLRLTPFRGLRYVAARVGSLAAVTSPPYDVVVRPDGQRHLETADPYNVVRLILPDAETPEARHGKAARTLAEWRDKGVLAADRDPALYVYEQRDGDHLQRGVIGALRLTPPEDGVVLPHEDVMPGPVADRAALMRATRANLEPLLLAYRDGDVTAALIEHTAGTREPLLDTTTEDGVAHRLWSLTDPTEVAAIGADLAGRQALIADGHHRWATYRRLQAGHPPGTGWDYGLVLLVDTSRHPLRVRAIHRVLQRLPLDRALKAARPFFRVRELPGHPLDTALGALAGAADAGNAFLLAGDSGLYLLDRPDPGALDRCVPADRPAQWRRLDATVLHTLLLDQVWRIPDSPDDIRYIHAADDAVEQALRHGGTAVLMHPVREHVVRDLARQGVMMPRKSTSFGPKPASGLVMRSLDLD